MLTSTHRNRLSFALVFSVVLLVVSTLFTLPVYADDSPFTGDVYEMKLSHIGDEAIAEYCSYNSSAETITLYYLIAAYDSSGKMVEFKSDILYVASETVGEVLLRLDFNPEYTYKSFFWNDAYVPVCNSWVLH